MKITLKDGSIKEYGSPISVYDIARDISEGLARAACAAVLNGKVVDLRTIVNEDSELGILTFQDEEGKAAYRHTTSHVLAEAVKRLYPEAKLAIGPSIDTGFYYDFDCPSFDREALDKIEAEMKKIIKDGIIVTMNAAGDVWDHGYVMFEDTKILAAGPEEELEKALQELTAQGILKAGETFEEIDAKRAIVIPGLVNTHCHLGMIPFRGLGDDCKDRLRVFLLPMENQAMDAEMARLSTRYAIGELLLSGVTTVLDMYYFEEVVAKVMDEMGIRGIAGETVMEKDSCDSKNADEAIRRGIALIEAYKDHPRVSGAITPHGTTTCSPETLKRAYEEDVKAGTVFTLHVAEMDYEMTQLREQYNMTPIEFMEHIGVLGPNTLAAHSIRTTEHDVEILAKHGASVAHCIASNTKAAKGVAPVSLMHKHGMSVGFGTDGPASGNTLDLFIQMRMCENFHKNELHDRSAFPAKEVVSMATIEGARALGLGDITGSIEPGKQADLVLVETDSPNMFPVYDPYSALVYSAIASNVRDVYVAGECLVKEKKLVREDFAKIRNDLREKMERTAFKDMKNLV